jgi:hypothetical protein
MRLSLTAVLGTLLSVPAQGQTVEDTVRALTSEEMEGRLTGTEGERRAAEYIARELEKLGVRPLPGQTSLKLAFEFTAGVKDDGSSLAIGDWKAPADALKGLSFSDTGRAEGPVVFAGYGITVPESKDFGYDSYHGLDVKDKIVLVLRYFPEDASTDVKSALARYSGLRFKALNARDRGARGLLVVSGPRSPNAGALAEASFDGAAAGSGIVAASIDGRLADELFRRAEGVSKTLDDAQKELDSGNPHVSGFALPSVAVDLEVRLERESRTAYNVVGLLPASAPGALADRVVVVGAHYDHLGRGKEGNSLAGKDEAGGIHPGADDNASGVAAVLRVAALLKDRERRAPVAFALWSGEELGLLGSSEFVGGKALDRARIAAYVNFDMVGRMQDNKLVLQAIGTSKIWPRLVEQTNVPIGFDVQLNEDPYLPTDVMSFNQAGVPSVNFFTGSHKEYHRPADRAELLNYDDLERVAEFGALLVQKVAALEEPPDFVKVARTRQDGGSRDTLRVFTGTIPDYTAELSGLRLSGVIEGGPAEEAGLRSGDVIVEFAGRKIANIYDYTYALDVVKVGEAITVVFLRDGERKETKLTPRARK